MISIENTENLTGVKISGDIHDLEALVDAFYAISIDEDDTKNSRYYDNSNRVLGFCYDIRHASMGDRDIFLMENGMNRDIMTFQSQITPEKNVYFSVNYLYPEMFFVTAALNELIEIYLSKNSKPKNEYRAAMNKAVIWDKHVAILRMLQSAFSECVHGTLTQAAFTRWLNIMNDRYNHVLLMCGHYLDYRNLEYLKLDKEKRLKKLSTEAKRIIEYTLDPVHDRIQSEAQSMAKMYGCSPSELVNLDHEYPEEIVW